MDDFAISELYSDDEEIKLYCQLYFEPNDLGKDTAKKDKVIDPPSQSKIGDIQQDVITKPAERSTVDSDNLRRSSSKTESIQALLKESSRKYAHKSLLKHKHVTGKADSNSETPKINATTDCSGLPNSETPTKNVTTDCSGPSKSVTPKTNVTTDCSGPFNSETPKIKENRSADSKESTSSDVPEIVLSDGASDSQVSSQTPSKVIDNTPNNVKTSTPFAFTSLISSSAYSTPVNSEKRKKKTKKKSPRNKKALKNVEAVFSLDSSDESFVASGSDSGLITNVSLNASSVYKQLSSIYPECVKKSGKVNKLKKPLKRLKQRNLDLDYTKVLYKLFKLLI